MDFWRDSYCQKILLQLLPRPTIPFPWTWGLYMTILTTSCKLNLSWKSLLLLLILIPFLARPSWEIISISMLVLCNAHLSTSRTGCSIEALNSVELTMQPSLWFYETYATSYLMTFYFQVNCWAGLAQLCFMNFITWNYWNILHWILSKNVYSKDAKA